MVCDGLTGIENAITSAVQKAAVQLCTIHLARNIQSKIKPLDKQQVATKLKAVLDHEKVEDNPIKGYEQFAVFMGNWLKKYPSLKSYLKPRNRLYFIYLGHYI